MSLDAMTTRRRVHAADTAAGVRYGLTMNAVCRDLRAVAASLLDPALHGDALQRACADLHAMALASEPALTQTPIALASGVAISPRDAANCILDAPRTACLARAVDAAVAARIPRSTPIEVLYAGCGPFAPLALCTAALRPDAPLRFTLIDAHAPNLARAHRLFERAGLAHMIASMVCEDAARWTRPPGPAPDILIAEVMQRALALEPQVAVLVNLSPQCRPDAAIVPSLIRIDLALRRLDTMFDAGVPDSVLGTALTLSRASLPALRAALLHDSTGLPDTVLELPRDAPSGRVGVLLTHVEAGDGYVLAPGASGLTQPLPLLAQGIASPGDRFRLRYRLEPVPGFDVTRMAAVGTGE